MRWGKGPRKYGNKIHTTSDGERFHSIAEFKDYMELKRRQDLGFISDLKRQVGFKLYGMGGTLIGTYTLDFTYREDEQNVAHETKAKGDTAFELRVKLFKDNYPGWVHRITGAYQKIKDKQNAKAREKRRAQKMLAMMDAE